MWRDSLLLLSLAMVLWSGWQCAHDERAPWWRWRGMWAVNIAIGLGLIAIQLGTT